MKKYFFGSLLGLVLGASLTSWGYIYAFPYTGVKYYSCYETESGARVAFGGAILVNGQLVRIPSNDRGADMIILGRLKPCEFHHEGETR